MAEVLANKRTSCVFALRKTVFVLKCSLNFFWEKGCHESFAKLSSGRKLPEFNTYQTAFLSKKDLDLVLFLIPQFCVCNIFWVTHVCCNQQCIPSAHLHTVFTLVRLNLCSRMHLTCSTASEHTKVLHHHGLLLHIVRMVIHHVCVYELTLHKHSNTVSACTNIYNKEEEKLLQN